MGASARGSEAMMELVGAWDGLGVVVRHDRPTGTWVFVALHDDTLGRPVGGCRMRVYDDPVDGLEDALRLARGMTSKWAVLDLPFGGGKAVLALPGPLESDARRELLLRFGGLLDSLGGAYATGEDMGTTPEDMALLAEISEHVHGVPGGPGPADPGPFTAAGVLAGTRAALEARTGSGELGGRTVLIQGVGDVGRPLAESLAAAGAKVLVSDVDVARVREVAEAVGAEVVAPHEVYGTECDVFAPCAVGAVLNDDTVGRLRCRVVAGSANNQLARPEHAGTLHDRGILYAPDYVINGGGALTFGLVALGTVD
ncbi:MAG: Glu/Leu/Phe/Val dehydrogenase dimerization domain-containing protein, partial [Gemmatimonadota bacterium]